MSQGQGGGRPLKFKTVRELEEKIQAYFYSCWTYRRDMFGNRIIDKQDPNHSKETPVYVMVKEKAYTVTGLAVFLDTTRDTLMDYEKRRGDKFSDAIKKAKLAIYADTEEALFRKGSATGAIFSLKNNYHWRDRTEMDMTTKDKPIPLLAGLAPNKLEVDDGGDSQADDSAQ